MAKKKKTAMREGARAPFHGRPKTAGSTVVSAKGQVVLPKAVRDALGWTPGTRLKVEETEGGLMLKPEKGGLQPTRLEDVFGMLKRKHKGPPFSDEDLEKAIHESSAAGAAERYARSFRDRN